MLERIKQFQNSACAWIYEQPSAPMFSADRNILSELIPELKALDKEESALYLKQLLVSNNCPVVEVSRKQLCKLTIDIEFLIIAQTLRRERH
ncbi:MAG: hypothetical protein WBD87_06575 [Candidatus Acidiferrales bacterium]